MTDDVMNQRIARRAAEHMVRVMGIQPPATAEAQETLLRNAAAVIADAMKEAVDLERANLAAFSLR